MFSLDHEDFGKSKKALIAAAISVVVASRVSVENSTISIFNMKIGVSTDVLNIVCALSFTYFLSIFIMMYSVKFQSDNLNMNDQINEISADRQTIGTNDHENSVQKIRILRNKRRISYLVDLGVPIAVSIYAIKTILHP